MGLVPERASALHREVINVELTCRHGNHVGTFPFLGDGA